MQLVSKQRCERRYPNLIHDSMLCADLGYWSSEFCQGDSGGPLVCKSDGKFYLEGTLSWISGCGAPGKFVVYAKLRYLVKWVKGNMEKF